VSPVQNRVRDQNGSAHESLLTLYGVGWATPRVARYASSRMGRGAGFAKSGKDWYVSIVLPCITSRIANNTQNPFVSEIATPEYAPNTTLHAQMSRWSVRPYLVD
jgi:hypothetical protein